MMQILPVLLKDGYKADHRRQYPPDATLVYSNLTPRRSRVPGVDAVIPFGFQYFVEEYLIRQFTQRFFALPRTGVLNAYKRRMDHYLGPGAVPVDHIGALHELGYLPLRIKAVPEGMPVPMRVPLLTIRNTEPAFFWLTNMVETLLSNILWLPITSATTAHQYRLTFDRFARETGADPAFCAWQGHDFSFRGLPGVEAALLSGAAHLLSFTGTDTIPAIDFLEEYYGANCETELIGGSVPATEHSVMCMGGVDGERETIRRLITEVYPKGIVSIVCDTWDFWKVITEILPSLRAEIMARDGKVVVRPDSGDPVDIICGRNPGTVPRMFFDGEREEESAAAEDGAIVMLARYFGATQNARGFYELDPHVGLIYGDSITPERQVDILTRLAAKGFASSNVVLGIGSFTYQMVTRDTYGLAVKATYGETRSGGAQALYKDPKTDDGTKKSATGLLCVTENHPEGEFGELRCLEHCTWADEGRGLLRTIFADGAVENLQTLGEIRRRLAAVREAALAVTA